MQEKRRHNTREDVIKEFREAGYPCVVLYAPIGHINGYVGIPASHPLYEVDMADSTEILRPAMERRMGNKLDNTDGFAVLINLIAPSTEDDWMTPQCAFKVHGGITYSDGKLPYENGSEGGMWWYGFDTAHHCDADDPKSAEYVEEECRKLAKQLKQVEEENE